MVKKIFTFLILIILSACTSDLVYDGGTRLVYEGTVTDDGGKPLAGVPVSVYVFRGGRVFFYTVYDSDHISYTTTDVNGHYRMVFPMPLNENNISVLINRSVPGTPALSAYANYEFYNIKPENLADYKINFGATSLYPLENSVVLTIIPGQNAVIEKLNITGLVNNNAFDYNFEDPVYENEELISFQIETQAAKNQVVTVHYRYTDETEGEEQIQINEQDVEYVLQ